MEGKRYSCHYLQIMLLGIYLEKNMVQKCLMFIAVLLAIAKTWKQPKCPLTDEWIKKMWYIYTMEYYSAIKRNEIGSFVETWMEIGRASCRERV